MLHAKLYVTNFCGFKNQIVEKFKHQMVNTFLRYKHNVNFTLELRLHGKI